MKVVTTFAFFSYLSIAAPTAFSQDPALTGCAAKWQDLTQQIQQARAAGNTQREAGLQKALKENQANCTDASLTKERQKKVASAQREVDEREADLKKAQVKGDQKNIDKRKEKLANAQKDMAEAQAELTR
jgi:hypothetical protein